MNLLSFTKGSIVKTKYNRSFGVRRVFFVISCSDFVVVFYCLDFQFKPIILREPTITLVEKHDVLPIINFVNSFVSFFYVNVVDVEVERICHSKDYAKTTSGFCHYSNLKYKVVVNFVFGDENRAKGAIAFYLGTLVDSAGFAAEIGVGERPLIK